MEGAANEGGKQLGEVDEDVMCWAFPSEPMRFFSIGLPCFPLHIH